MADDLDFICGKRRTLYDVNHAFVSLLSTNNTVNGETLTYEVGYVIKEGNIQPIFFSRINGDVVFTLQSNDIYTLWRLIEFFGRVNVRPVETNIDPFYVLLSRDSPLDEVEAYEETLSEDFLTIIAMLLLTRIPDSLVQFAVENPNAVPPYLTTFEIIASCIEWSESMRTSGILTPEQVDALDREIEKLEEKYDSLLRQYAGQVPLFYLHDEELSPFSPEDVYYNLATTLLLMYECMDDVEESPEVLIFLTLFMFYVYQLEIPDENIMSALQILSPTIVTWMQNSDFCSGDLKLITAEAVNLLPGIIAGRRKRIILYDLP